jgi:hypothetical protein
MLIEGLTVCRFYYTNEQKADGLVIFKVSGEAYGNFFWELAKTKTQGLWLVIFIKGVRYKNFGPYRL